MQGGLCGSQLQMRRLLSKFGKTLRQQSFTVNAVFGARFVVDDTVLDMMVEHFEDLYYVFAYHAFSCNRAIKLCSLGVKRMNGPRFGRLLMDPT